MALISLICLLALSSSAFARSSYDSYSARDALPRTLVAPVQSGYGSSQLVQQLPIQTEQQLIAAPKPIVALRGYGSGYQQQFADQPTQPIVVPPTEADILCRGKRPETIIPLDDGRRFVVCLDDSKGEEQKCPKGLLFHPESRRCERRLGPLDNLCSSQPCLNNGQCLPIDSSSYQCKCAPGFDGTICELDARVCQTQQPCGQAPGTRCQSFRASAALSYICIHQNEFAYGFSAQQVQPSPCRGVDGAVPLPITDKAFAMCDGERMFIESCPGGTLWDDTTKACVWPDMRSVITSSAPATEQIKSLDYGQRTMLPQSSYETQTLIQKPIVKQQDFQTSSYGSQQLPLQQQVIQKPIDLSIQSTSSYGEQPIFQQQQQQPIQRQLDFQPSSYGRQQLVQQQQPIQRQLDFQSSSYGSQQVPIQQTFSQPMQKLQQDFRPVQQTSSY